MRINTNVSALQSYGNLSKVQSSVSDSMAKLSSGFRINKAGDDAAGLGIANKLRGDIRTLSQASKNAEQANALLQISEGATGTIQKMVERMKELAAQSASSNSGDRAQLQAEFNTLRTEIGRIVNTTTYQGAKLINGTMGNVIDAVTGTLDNEATVQSSTIKLNGAKSGLVTFARVDATHLSATDADGNVEIATVATTGAQSVSFSRMGVSFDTAASFDITAAWAGGTVDVDAGATAASFLVSGSGSSSYGDDLVTLASAINLGTGATALNLDASTIATQAGAQSALASLDSAITKINDALGTIGATQNRVNFALENVKTTVQNFTAAESVIRDVDMAEEMVKFSKNNILAQAGTAMLAQANQAGQGVLQLLRG
jgi:flagellin